MRRNFIKNCAMKNFSFQNSEGKNIRLDKFLVEEFAAASEQITRSKIQKAIINGDVSNKKGEKLTNCAQKIAQETEIHVIIKESAPLQLKAKKINFTVAFEDDDLIVVNKPAGLTVHPGAGNYENTLVNALLYRYGDNLSQLGEEFRPGIVHRLDKDTSGLMLVAKNDFTHQILAQKIQNREVKRSYLAFIYGVMSPLQGKIEKNIARSRFNRLKMRIAGQNSLVKSRGALTHYQTKEVFHEGFASLVECQLETGRTHQIRLHFESEKHSLIGDQLYNSCRRNFSGEIGDFAQKFPRQALHSCKIAFEHPRNGAKMEFEAGLPDDMARLYELLRG